MKYILYARKSTDSEDRQIQSIEDQEKELKEIARKRGVDIVKIFSESRSAKQPGRPKYNEMIQMIKDGEADGVLCWKINRLARNPIDGGEIQWLLQQGRIKSILTPFKEYLTSDNVIMMAFELGMASQFIIDLSKDVKRGMNSKRDKGWRPNRAPQGYLNDKYGEKGQKQIFTDPDRFSLVRKMWDLLLTGNHTVFSIIKIANEKWGYRTREGNKLTISTVYKMFKNSFYCGQYEYNGEILTGKHEPMVNPEEFDMAQIILGKKGKPRPKNKRLPFTGIIECGECGAMITTEEKLKYVKSTGGIKRYIYHHCSKRKKGCVCRQKPIKHENLLFQMNQILESITIPEEFLHWALETLRESNQIEEHDRSLILINLHKQHEKCVQSIGNLIKIYTSTENANVKLLTIDEYKEQKNLLLKEKANIETEIRRNESGVNEWVELTEKTFHFATYAKVWFEKGDFEKKAEIFSSLGQNFLLKDGKLTLELSKPYLVIKEGLENVAVLKATLEPNNDANESQKQALLSLWSG